MAEYKVFSKSFITICLYIYCTLRDLKKTLLYCYQQVITGYIELIQSRYIANLGAKNGICINANNVWLFTVVQKSLKLRNKFFNNHTS